MTITDDDLRRLVELSEKATPGPWCYENVGEKENCYAVGTAWRYDDESKQISGSIQDLHYDEDGEEQLYTEAVCFCEDGSLSAGGDLHHNAEFIVLARNLAPQLAAEVLALRAELEDCIGGFKAIAVTIADKFPATAQAALQCAEEARAALPAEAKGGESKQGYPCPPIYPYDQDEQP